MQKGRIFILSAPAGTGKTTLVDKLIQEFPSAIVRSVSFTTRSPRAGEVEGVDYHFISKEDFKKKIAENAFLEHVELYGDYYGTSKEWVESQQRQGKHVILVIDTQGAKKLRGSIDATFIFLMPPTWDELKMRLIKRNTESLEQIKQRLEWAKREFEEGRYYDYQIVNDDLNKAYQELRGVVIAEEHKQKE